ncbi:hypothetical protein D0Y50_06065 [Salinimonas sediminis]|uniref:Uncharacterized protein n=1 Tax=Salinimonas sediminis TaxID=2303538 RepID=A0A346NKC7_9ALTE|nr:hypothetical protein D0Y50_06065 [Salinimonas sediminis]
MGNQHKIWPRGLAILNKPTYIKSPANMFGGLKCSSDIGTLSLRPQHLCDRSIFATAARTGAGKAAQ